MDLINTRKNAWKFGSRRPLRERGVGLRVLLDIPYENSGDPKNKLDLYLPEQQKFPVVVFIHGGGWVTGDKSHHANVGNFLAKNGIGTVAVNYRLAPQVRYPIMPQDVAKAVSWAHKHIGAHGGDPDQLFLFGHSAGGHLASLLATNPEFLGAEGLSFEHLCGVVTMSGVYKIHWNMRFYGTNFVFHKSNKTAASPHWNVSPGCPPFYVMYAKNEIWTLGSQARRFHKQLLKHNVSSHLLTVPGCDHTSIVHNISLPKAIHGTELLRFVRERI